MQRARSRGITLIELMVVVVVISILAGIAYPSYRQYAVRSNRTEGKTAALQAAIVLEKCYTNNHTYEDCDIVDGATPTGKYSLSLEVGADDDGREGQVYLLTATPQGAQATDDAGCGSLTLDHTGDRDVTGTKDRRECW
jgi:type IV pilus assembly protein PilE